MVARGGSKELLRCDSKETTRGHSEALTRRGSGDWAAEDKELACLKAQETGFVRSAFRDMLNSGTFGGFMLCVVMSNLICAVVETDYRASNQMQANETLPAWIEVPSYIFLFVYASELGARIYVYQWAFPKSYSNLFDVLIVLFEIVFATVLMKVVLPSAGPLRIFRLIRLLRAVRVMRHFRELYLMSYGFASASKAICWAALLICLCLLLWSIIAVEVLNPINQLVAQDGEYADCARCPHAFESVSSSLLTFTQQIIAGDSWGRVSVPIIEREPYTALVFLSLIVTVHLGLMNLVLTVIVDSAQEAREHDVSQRVMEKAKTFKKAKVKLEDLCRQMDLDQDGTLSLDEVMKGYDSNQDFRDTMRMMDTKKDDLPMIFKILDEDRSGDVTPEEFVEQIHKMKHQDLRTLIVFIRHHVIELKDSIHQHLRVLRSTESQSSPNHGESKSIDTTDEIIVPCNSMLASLTPTSATPTALGKATYLDAVPAEEALPPHQRPPQPPPPPPFLGTPAAPSPPRKEEDRLWLVGRRQHDGNAGASAADAGGASAILEELASVLAEARRRFLDQEQLFARGLMLLDEFAITGTNGKLPRPPAEHLFHSEPRPTLACETRSAPQSPTRSKRRGQSPPSQARQVELCACGGDDAYGGTSGPRASVAAADEA